MNTKTGTACEQSLFFDLPALVGAGWGWGRNRMGLRLGAPPGVRGLCPGGRATG